MDKDAEDKYAFIEMKNMTSVYEITDILDLSQMAYAHFMNYDDEVLYLLRNCRKLTTQSKSSEKPEKSRFLHLHFER